MKFDYPELTVVSELGYRWYLSPKGSAYASVTSILGGTVSDEKAASLKSWQTSLGIAKADKITNDAAKNGTAVHLLAERYLKKEELVRDGDNFSQADTSGFNALKLKLNKVDEVWGQEVSLYSDALEIAGRCDCIGIYRGVPNIIDFKTSIRLKNEKQIEDYKLQICGYAQMHNALFNTDIRHGVILMTSAGGFPQEFNVDLTQYVEPLKLRIKAFYSKLEHKIK
jgi:ATP-dependent exoDNAse (exonuclease V) beta subunit